MVSSSIKTVGLFATMAFAQSSGFSVPSSVEAVSTVYDTVIETITSCAPTVTNCPYGRQITSLVPVVPVTTVYTTEYVDVCPTGVVTSTYTITQACGLAACAMPTEAPHGFAVVTKVCTACEGKPTLTVTVPVAPTMAPYSNTTVTVPANACPGPNCPAAVTGPAGCNGANCPPPAVATPVVTVPAAGCNGANCPPPAAATVVVPVSAAGCNGTACPPTTPAVVVTAGASKMGSVSIAGAAMGLFAVFAWAL